MVSQVLVSATENSAAETPVDTADATHIGQPPGRTLVLASTSQYRRALLQQLHVTFETSAPDCDESALPGESVADQVVRLAIGKAQAVRSRFPDAVIIGSDQLAELDGAALGKPLTPARATEQLQRCSGRTVIYRTGLCVLDARSGEQHHASVDASLVYRELSDDEIGRYLAIEQPFHSAGSMHLEGLGPSLLSNLTCSDPSAIIGLPLIKLCQLLRKLGVAIP